MTWKDVAFLAVAACGIVSPMVVFSLLDHSQKIQFIENGYVQQVVDGKVIWTLPIQQEKE